MFRPPRIRQWTLRKTSFGFGRRPLLPAPPVASPSFFLLWTLLFLLLPGCTAQEAFFCPQDACADRLIEEIEAATLSVHVAIAYFNHEAIADALIAARERGVDVKVVGEKDENRPASETSGAGINYDVVRRLKGAGVSYRDDGNPYLMHHKFAVIDGRLVLTGSFNYTQSADERNNENLVALTSARMATAFEGEFEALWADGEE